MHININEGFIFYEKNLPHHKGQFHWSEMLFCSTGPCYLPLGISKPCKHSKQIYPWGCTYMEFWPLLIFVYPLPLLYFVFKPLYSRKSFSSLSLPLLPVSPTRFISVTITVVFSPQLSERQKFWPSIPLSSQFPSL